uniref:Fucose-specific lectin n=1 Tax=Bionectria ochroleuca TaxID=29856 RepID=A0A8H7N5W2_BIOOC
MKLTRFAHLCATIHAAAATITPGSLITVTENADNTNVAAWWTPLDEFGGFEWLAYLRNPTSGSFSNNNVMVARRDMTSGALNRDCLKKTASEDCVLFADDAGHNQPSIALDGDGFVHVFTSMHNNAWRYYRSDDPYSASLIDQSSTMPDQGVLITYPVIKRDASGNLWLAVRGDSGDGVARGGYLYKYETAKKTWSRVTIWAYRKGYSVYPDDIQFSSDGDIHLQWEWSKYPASAGRHEGSYLRYKPSSGEFKTIIGDVVSVPVTQSTSNVVFQPLTSGEVYGDNGAAAPLLQSAKLALYEQPAGTVHVQHAYRFQNATGGPWQVRRAVGGSASQPWSREILYADQDTSAAVGFTHEGTTARIYYCRTGGSAWVLEKSGSTPWTNTELAPVKGKGVQRLQAIMRTDGTDILYLGAPTNVDASTGSVYLLSVKGR